MYHPDPETNESLALLRLLVRIARKLPPHHRNRLLAQMQTTLSVVAQMQHDSEAVAEAA